MADKEKRIYGENDVFAVLVHNKAGNVHNINLKEIETMARVSKIICDACGCDTDSLRVAIKYKTHNNIDFVGIMGTNELRECELDLCNRCALQIAQCYKNMYKGVENG